MNAATSQLSRTFAVNGGSPAFPSTQRLGQHYFPDWTRYETAFRDIFARQYYTNHGPLAQRLEARAAEYLGVRHAMCITNEAIALCLAAQALGLHGKVLVPAIAGMQLAQSLQWAGCEPVYCDVDPRTGMMDAQAARTRLAAGDIVAILAADLFGSLADHAGLQAVADEFGLPLYFDSCAAFGSTSGGRSRAGDGRMQVFSMQSSHVLSAGEGAFIVTDDDQLAAHVRNIRSNYGMGQVIVPVVKTSNGRFSEAQAAVALASFDDLEAHVARNQQLRQDYVAALSGIAGIDVLAPAGVDRSNGQSLMLRVDASQFGLSGRQLIALLRAENVQAEPQVNAGFYRHDSRFGTTTLPVADAWHDSLVELPLGSKTDAATVATIAALFGAAHAQAAGLSATLGAGR